MIPLLAEAWRKRGGSIGVSSGVNNLVGVRSRKPRVSFRGRTFVSCWWAEGRGSCAKALADAKVISCWWAEGRGSCAKALAEAKVISCWWAEGRGSCAEAGRKVLLGQSNDQDFDFSIHLGSWPKSLVGGRWRKLCGSWAKASAEGNLRITVVTITCINYKSQNTNH